MSHRMQVDGMTTTDAQISTLRQHIGATETQLRNLKLQLQHLEQQAEAARYVEQAYQGGHPAEWIAEVLNVLQIDASADIAQRIRQESARPGSLLPPDPSQLRRRWPLEGHEYKRYGRQMIMPEIGLHGQLRLKNARVLIVGVGGLGCPAASYLAGAGVGTLGLMDGDTVEVSNLHRQIAHATTRVGTSKVDSAYEYLKTLNASIRYNRYRFNLTSEKAIAIFEPYDLVLDCTDHPTSRYLISDACVLTGKPLVSASALKTEGQLMVLNNPPRFPGDTFGGPCYRCIFPKPPPTESVLSCGEGGILGPVVGVMGVLQALEAIKVLASSGQNENGMGNGLMEESAPPTLLMFSAYSNPQFRTVRLRSRRHDCAVCSSQATITTQSLADGSLNYVAFCGANALDNVLPPESRISATEFAQLPRDMTNVLIDTRDETQYAMCALKGSINVPWTGNADTWLERAIQRGGLAADGANRYIICRLGNDSQLAAKAILDRAQASITVKDIEGGFKSWREEVDPSWPDY